MSLRHRSCVVGVHWCWAPTIICSLHLTSCNGSCFCRRDHLWWWVRSILICRCLDKCLEFSWHYFSLKKNGNSMSSWNIHDHITVELAKLTVSGTLSLLFTRPSLQLDSHWVPPRCKCYYSSLTDVLPCWSSVWFIGLWLSELLNTSQYYKKSKPVDLSIPNAATL